MKKTIIVMLTLMLMLVSVLSAKSATLPANMVPGNAKWVLHLDVKQFLSTKLSDMLKKNYMGDFDEHMQKLSAEFKFDPFNDTTGITVFGTDKGDENLVVCWAGKFDKPHLLSLLAKAPGYKTLKYGKFTLHNWEKEQFGVFVNTGMLMWARNESAIKNALDTFRGKKKNMTASSLMSQMKDIPGDAFLRAAANNIAALADDDEASMILKNTGMALFIAMERNENLKLNLRLTTDTPETAKNIEQIVNGFMGMAKMQKESKDPWWDLLDNLKTKLKGNILQFELTYPSKALLAMLEHKKDHKHDHKKHVHDKKK